MAVKAFSEQLRQAVLHCGKTRYRISKETGITEAQLSRFVNGHADLALSTIDKLADCIAHEWRRNACRHSKEELTNEDRLFYGKFDQG